MHTPNITAPASLRFVVQRPHPLALSDAEVDGLLRARGPLQSVGGTLGPKGREVRGTVAARVLWPRLYAAAKAFGMRSIGDRGTTSVLEYPPGSAGFPWHHDRQALDAQGEPTDMMSPALAVSLKSRTLSCMALLTDGTEYEGGDLLVRDRAGNEVTMPRSLGTVVIFPPDTHHSVTPVTGGTRLCCVTFISQR